MATSSSSAQLAIAALEGFPKSWVLFSHGTVAITSNSTNETTVKEEAIKLMKDYGPVAAGSSHGDFSVSTFGKAPGWIVSSHHNDINTFVAPDQVESGASDFFIGMFGRNNRDLDSKDLKIIYVSVHSDAQ